MKTIKQFCLLAFMLVFVSSCSRIVHTDYERLDHGEILSIDSVKMGLTVHSFLTGDSVLWFTSSPDIDRLSMWGLEYHRRVSVGDTVTIYLDNGQFFATLCDIKDAQDINQSLVSYYWEDIANNWYIFVLATLILGVVFSGIYKRVHQFSPDFQAGLMVAVAAISYSVFLTYCNCGSTLSQMNKGRITDITPLYVEIDNAHRMPYATLDDISTHRPVKVGQDVVVYAYGLNSKLDRNFFSTRELNVEAVKASQSYPENFLMTSVLFVIAILVGSGLFLFPNRWLEQRKEKKQSK